MTPFFPTLRVCPTETSLFQPQRVQPQIARSRVFPMNPHHHHHHQSEATFFWSLCLFLLLLLIVVDPSAGRGSDGGSVSVAGSWECLLLPHPWGAAVLPRSRERERKAESEEEEKREEKKEKKRSSNMAHVDDRGQKRTLGF